MKKIFILIFSTLSLLVLTTIFTKNQPSLNNFLTFSLCDNPIQYHIDTVDPKFKLTKEEFTADVNEAAAVWNNSSNKKLFEYDPKGELSVSLIYDERQSLTTQINQLEESVNSDKQSLNPKVSEYEKRVLEFKQKLEDLNKRIEEWNSKGGAPADEYKKITEEQKTLQEEANSLNSLAQSLNISTHEYNTQVNKLNKTVQTFNNALEQRPEEGIFKGPQNSIEIYFNISKTELIHTLAHELGHALGLGHLSNPKSIMFFRTNQTVIPTKEDKAAVEEICKRHNIFEVVQNYISLIINNYQKAF